MNSFERLISAMAGVPVLSGARCRGRHATFDSQRDDEPDEVADARHLQALGLCECCPALDACEQWFESLPLSQRPHGVIAGRLHRETKPRKRKKAS